MGKSIILELQANALDSTIGITTLIRKSYVIAKKLKIHEFEKWLSFEMNGYTCEYNEIPDYRLANGLVKAWDPFHGWIPVIISDKKTQDIYCDRRIADKVANLENLLSTDSDYAVINFGPAVRNILASNTGFDTNFQLQISKTIISSIIETVRNVVLDWALRLEGDGILGEEMTFSEEEKVVAEGKNYTVNHFHGSVSNSQFQQNSQYSTQTMNNQDTNIDIEKLLSLLKMVEDNIEQVNLPSSERKEFDTKIETVQAQIKSKKPSKQIIFECLSSARNILEGFIGSMAASGLIYHFGLFLQQP